MCLPILQHSQIPLVIFNSSACLSVCGIIMKKEDLSATSCHYLWYVKVV